MQSTLTVADLNHNPSSQRVLIVGGGIVGAALAFYLSKPNSSRHIVLLDRSLEESLGSTGHAPGFVGQLNESSALTRLAQDTASEYLSIPGGFNTVGGLELATTASGEQTLQSRCKKARAAGLPAEIITPEAAASLAPDFINPDTVKTGLHFPSDGTADAQAITSYFTHEARARGVEFLEAAVTGFATVYNDDGTPGEITAIRTAKGDINLAGSTVILATGIWTSSLTSPANGNESSITQFPVPIIPVAHPYTFTPARPARMGKPYPFVRWPEHHVYARDHGDRDGLGSYDHAPLQLNPGDTAIGAWPSSFDEVLLNATSHLKNGKEFLVQGRQGELDSWAAKEPFNGIFSVTPDNLPLAGRVPDVSNLWLCAAIWVTTAAGTAKLISREILRGSQNSTSAEDEELLKAVNPARFQGLEAELLTAQALGRYNNIYNKETSR
ncbi:FAD dependent oxidoreductase [Penicillium canariense]|uniref:FAD dependent oxidoreductase n=1 Tax=Penicillium canariense TaxID=189055 RepID=A0A9W9IGS9_9EURO|nr:FAD dependent oxidoreductase [Penicillium canariense]KAJ5176097.1 FAD dependent oxidoreductase [Penicillium canariense]